MRRFYQESWQGIPFTTFSHISFFHLAEPRFYAIFYEELFKRYKDWNDLPELWRENKIQDADWLSKQILEAAKKRPPQKEPIKVLSIGSGVGFMEKELVTKIPEIELHVNEPSTVGMKWLRKVIPANRIYIGLPPACLPSNIKWDVIYLSAVDYGLPEKELAQLLTNLRFQLASHGELICISASLLEEYSFIGSMVNVMKIVIRAILHFTGVRNQQFWGWRRTQKEYQNLFENAGFTHIEDGFLKDKFDSYWIKGLK